MKFYALAAVAATLVAVPATAQTNRSFVGPRAEVTVGVENIDRNIDYTDVTYGLNAGIDAPVGDRVTLGVEVNSLRAFSDDRQVGVAGRVGYAFNDRTLGYVKGGYDNYRLASNLDLEGFQVGAGVERMLNRNVFTKVEYRYSDFDHGVGSHAVHAGFGLRF